MDKLVKNNSTVTPLTLRQFKSSIQRHKHSQLLMIFYKQNQQWAIEGVHVLSSPSYNWTLRMVNMNGVEWLEARQADGATLVKEITGILERAKQPIST